MKQLEEQELEQEWLCSRFSFCGPPQLEADLDKLILEGKRIFDVSIVLNEKGELEVLVVSEPRPYRHRRIVKVSRAEMNDLSAQLNKQNGLIKVAWHPQGEYALVISMSKPLRRQAYDSDLLD